jgi:hypothetical protein
MRPLLRSGASPISSAAIDRGFLAPSMDARAHNLDQYNPSPGVDSQLERIRALALRLPPSPECEALMAEVDEAIASNLREAEAELGLCGTADQLVSDLRHLERNRLADVLGAKAIARHLRPALECSLCPQGRSAGELTTARDLLRGVVAEVPRLMLLSAAVERELGKRKFAVLRDQVENKGGASRLQSAGATEEQGTAPHVEL